MSNEKPGLIGEVFPQLPLKVQSSTKIGEILLHRDIPTGKSRPDKSIHIDQKLAHKNIQHGKPRHCANPAL